ncbi:DUF887-domain-containing protein [Lophiostoma macrostomum CBS 122681]|uniref:DUF887-domain-containing protein n=1 Tax=Lophiostoma macrostomum CBS 122681 TaxID=1314788 RepID=A0A6A6TJF0_9PLEO|nr:DUF887-domain-containing protein [Lophiostoma macrostomum CBS 122681]
MRDPFPLSPPAGIAKTYIQPFADYTGLQTLPLHFHEVAFAFLLYHGTHKYVSPAFSRFFFPQIYASFNARTKLNWDVHIVSFVQSTLINVLALWVMYADEERGDMNWQGKVFGYTGASGLIQGFAAGYFVWDLFVTLQNVGVFGPGMLAHAVSALFVFALGFRPFVNFYAPTFILYELSSPFLNIHWFCDKLNLTGSKIQLYNGILLLLTFFSCRLCWGSYQSARVFYDVYRTLKSGHVTLHDPQLGKLNNGTYAPEAPVAGSEIMQFAGDRIVPVWLAAAYLASNLVLNGLNWFWFGKMIETIRKRFDPPLGTRKPEKADKAGTTLEKEHMSEVEKVLVEGIHVETPGAVTPTEDYVAAVHVEKERNGRELKVGVAEVRSRGKRSGKRRDG